ncbi:hypothetical protein AMK68_04475, partial [candidate division KD3-62 bacterium DG_56]
MLVPRRILILSLIVGASTWLAPPTVRADATTERLSRDIEAAITQIRMLEKAARLPEGKSPVGPAIVELTGYQDAIARGGLSEAELALVRAGVEIAPVRAETAIRARLSGTRAHFAQALGRLEGLARSLGLELIGFDLAQQGLEDLRDAETGEIGDLSRQLIDFHKNVWLPLERGVGRSARANRKTYYVVLPRRSTSMMVLAATFIQEARLERGQPLALAGAQASVPAARTISIGIEPDAPWANGNPEAFKVTPQKRAYTLLAGASEVGLLRGCAEAAEAIATGATLRAATHTPGMVCRGVVIPLPAWDRGDDGAWFYDADWWLRTLRRLARARYNIIVLRGKEPLPHLLRPRGKDVSAATLGRRMGTLDWVLDVARDHGFTVGLFWDSPPAGGPEWTRALSEEMLRTYYGIGAVGCAGNVAHWKALIEAVTAYREETGLARALMLPAWLEEWRGIAEALPRDHRVWTLARFNGQMLDVTARPHQSLGDLPGTGCAFFDGLVNLSPYGFGSAEFINECLGEAARAGAEGIIVSPLDPGRWPATGLRAGASDQTNRDWAWYDAFGLYAWDPESKFDAKRWQTAWGVAVDEPAAGRAVERTAHFLSAALPTIVTEFWLGPTWLPQLNALPTPDGSWRWATLDDLIAARSVDSPIYWQKGPVVLGIAEFVADPGGSRASGARLTPPEVQGMLRATMAEARSHYGNAAARAKHSDLVAALGADLECLESTVSFWDRRISAAIALQTFRSGGRQSEKQRAVRLAGGALDDYRRLLVALEKHYGPDVFSTVETAELVAEAEQELSELSGKPVAPTPMPAPMPTPSPVGTGEIIATPGGDAVRPLLEALRPKAEEAGWTLMTVSGAVPESLPRCRMLLIDDIDRALPETRHAEVLDWVKMGGRVIVWSMRRAHSDFFPYLLVVGEGETKSMAFADVDSLLLGDLRGAAVQAARAVG